MGNRAIVLALAGLALSGCGSAGAATTSVSPSASTSVAAKTAPVRMAINGQVPSAAWVWLMGDAGVFSKNGVNVELRGMTGQASTEAMVGGDLDAELHAGVALDLSAAANGTPLAIVADMQPINDLEVVVPEAITAPEQLRGKKVGSQSGTSANAMSTQHYLNEHGLSLGRDYTMVLTGTAGSEAGMVAQLVSHQVDAITVTQDAANAALKQGGFHVLVDLAKTNLRTAGQILVFQAPFVQQHPDTVQRMVDSMIQGVRYVREHKADAEAVMRSRFKMTDQTTMDEFYARQAQVLTNDPKVLKDDFADVLATMPSNAPRLSDEQLSKLLDNHFVADAERRGLTNF